MAKQANNRLDAWYIQQTKAFMEKYIVHNASPLTILYILRTSKNTATVQKCISTYHTIYLTHFQKHRYSSKMVPKKIKK
jgi:hypothetical protein